MKEIWKDIEGYEGLYQVSNLGRVKSCERWCDSKHGVNTRFVSEKIRKLIYNSNYMRVSLNKDGIKTLHYVHRLVGKAFIPIENGKEWINHIDGIKINNNVNNLEWTNASHNAKHAWALGIHNNQYTKHG